MKTHYVIFHSADLDGFCSGAISLRHLLLSGVKIEVIEMIGWNYGNLVPVIPDDAQVIMTDISFPVANMCDIKKRCFLTWIDHHKTAIEDSNDFAYNDVPGLRKVGDSASLLAWMFFFGLEYKIPQIVYWVDRYDVWKKEDPQRPSLDWAMVMRTQHGMRFYMSNPSCEFAFGMWNSSFSHDDFMKSISKTGEILLESEEKQNKVRCSKAFDLVFEGIKFAVLNNGIAGSNCLNSYARSDHDALMVFSYNGKKEKWDVSMYKNEASSQEIDLSVIAKKYGGGGHAGACGFMVDDINQVIKYKNIPAHLVGISSNFGLLYKNGVVIPMYEADSLARLSGFQYAEELVKALK